MSLSVLLLAYPHFNTLDLNGPLEVLANAALPTNPPPFAIHIASATTLTHAAEHVTLHTYIPLTHALAHLHEYDILIVPGAPPDAIMPHLVPDDHHFGELLDIATTFAKLGPREGRGERIILSICTGALFLGYAGIFDGLSATTHHLALDTLQTLCNEYKARTKGAKGTTVERGRRYVDAGLNGYGVRVVSSGGISCGLDACLWLVGLVCGRDMAVNVAGMMEYAWREDGA